MDNIETRFATSSDLGRIVEIYNQAVDDARTADIDHVTVEDRLGWFDSHEAGTFPIIVACRADSVVGWASLSPHRPGRRALRHTAEVSYYVDSNCRREGIGTTLLTRVVELCPPRSIENIFALLLEDNVASVTLLRKFGFVQWGRLPAVADFDGRKVGQVLFGRSI